MRFTLYFLLLTLSVFIPKSLAGFNPNYLLNKKHATTTAGYFSSPNQIKAMAYFDNFKIIDDTIATTIPVSTQVEFAAGTQTADVFVPENYKPNKPIAIYIHINSSDAAYMPTSWQGILSDAYCIGASPDNCGNNRHDPWRMARVLDLIASLKDQYNIDEDRIYLGGTSGGALISMLTGMLYPEVITGLTPTEHCMISSYWSKIFTTAEVNAMAKNNQRWSIIIGSDSYAFNFLYSAAYNWRQLGFDSQRKIIPGMAHTHPSATTLAESIAWIDAPVQQSRARTYTDWLKHSFDSEDASGNRGPEDDFDADGVDNFTEYKLGTDPTDGSDKSSMSLLMNDQELTVSYRHAALDINFAIHTSTNLVSWDTTGAGVQLSTPPSESEAVAKLTYTATDMTDTKKFYRASSDHLTLTNLTQLTSNGVKTSVATQSTTGWGGLASYGIDGNTDPEYNNNSVTHTDLDSNNWWQVNLGATRTISRVKLYNRNSTQNRLSNFRISILDASGTEIISQDFYTTTGHVVNTELWDLPKDTEGQIIKITMLGDNRNGNKVISLAEVEILGPTP